EQMMANSLTGPGAMPPPAVQRLGVFGLADISQRFDFLARPAAQHGGSLLGMENVVTHVLIQMSQAARAFEFDHGTAADVAMALTQDDICPPADPGVGIFRPRAQFPAVPI